MIKRPIAFIQPAVPHYREEFFIKLAKNIPIEIYATNEDFLGVESTLRSNFVRYQKKFLRFGAFYWHLGLPIKYILQNHEIIVLNGNLRIVNYMLLLFLSRMLGKQVIWWGHLNSAGKQGFASGIRKQIMRFASKRLFYTDYELTSYPHPKNCYSINNGVPSIGFDAKQFPDKFSYNRPLRILFIGRLTVKSRINFALTALSRCTVPFELHIIGDGPAFSSCTDFMSDPRFIWYNKIINDHDISKIASECDVFIYPGAVGLSLIKSFVLGLPAIIHSNRLNHMPEFAAAQNQHNSIFFEEGNSNDLLNKIEMYYALCSTQRRKLSLAARSTVQNDYNTDSMVERMLVCIRSKQ